jgi:hypothetical protein
VRREAWCTDSRDPAWREQPWRASINHRLSRLTLSLPASAAHTAWLWRETRLPQANDQRLPASHIAVFSASRKLNLGLEYADAPPTPTPKRPAFARAAALRDTRYSPTAEAHDEGKARVEPLGREWTLPITEAVGVAS